jgi:hypothetical protein
MAPAARPATLRASKLTMKERNVPLLPKDPTDLTLAPVAVNIDRNLARIRDLLPEQIAADVALQLNRNPALNEHDRAEQIRRVALRNVEMHNWDAAVSADFARLKLVGGSVTIELGLSHTIRRYIEG